MEDDLSLASESKVICNIQSSIMCDQIWVLVPPKYWGHPNLAECVKKAILLSQKKEATNEQT